MMDRINLDHSINGRSGMRMADVLLIAGAFAAIVLLVALQYTHKKSSALEDAIYHLQDPANASSGTRGAASTEKREEIAEAKQVMAELALPWETLFETLEALYIPDIKLIALEPAPRQGRLRLTAEASDVGIMLLYIERLSKKPIFRNVMLVSQEQTTNDGLPVRFSVEATWKP